MGQKIAFGIGMFANQMFPAILGIFMVVLVEDLGFFWLDVVTHLPLPPLFRCHYRSNYGLYFRQHQVQMEDAASMLCLGTHHGNRLYFYVAIVQRR